MPGRKSHRRQRGICRTAGHAFKLVRGVKTVWNRKLEKHYRFLLRRTKAGAPSSRMVGLWRWRHAALALHAAGIEVQSGTLPTERLWASLLEMLPPTSRTVSPRWFSLLSKLAFLRFNFRHWHQNFCPTWTESDALLAERVENLASAAAALQGDDYGCLQELFDPFTD